MGWTGTRFGRSATGKQATVDFSEAIGLVLHESVKSNRVIGKD